MIIEDFLTLALDVAVGVGLLMIVLALLENAHMLHDVVREALNLLAEIERDVSFLKAVLSA